MGPKRICSLQNSITVFLWVKPLTRGPGKTLNSLRVSSLGLNFNNLTTLLILPWGVYFGFTVTNIPEAKLTTACSLINLQGVKRCGSLAIGSGSRNDKAPDLSKFKLIFISLILKI